MGTHWLSICLTSRAAFTACHTAMNHVIPAALLSAVYPDMLVLRLWDLIPTTENTGSKADLFVFVLKGLPDCFVDVAVTCPTASSPPPQASDV